MVIAAFVVACLAVVVAAFSAWYGRGQKRAADLAAAEARRAADAAAETVRIEQARRAEEVAEAERRRVRFELVPVGEQNSGRYILRNSGTDSAYAVHVDTGDLGGGGQATDFDEFKAEEEQMLFLIKTYGTRTEYVEIVWHQNADHSDPQRSVRLLIR
ncbi:hypothetical protein [Parafrankia sp. FMc2]|uniref:hypothetical protein n=1 Tax=Parafrankia sp. FMc2 TaxID=3233196 RepID=UPI0034D646F7